MFSQTDLNIMARTLWGEARGEEFAGKVAVGWVIVNRFRKPGWWSRNPDDIPDDTIAAVCRDPKQFSCWNASDPNAVKLQVVNFSDANFPDCLKAVGGVLSGNCPDPTGGSTHYKVTTLPWPNDWGAEKPALQVIGAHSFYRLEG